MPVPAVGMLLASGVVLVLIGRRLNIGLCLLVGTAVLALFSRLAPAAVGLMVWKGLTQPKTVELVLNVVAITSLAGVLQRSGLLKTLVDSVTILLGGARLAIMAVPSIIGALPVLGGAILSAPMVDGLGERLNLTPHRKAAVNLVFRHAWFYVAPFAPSLVLASQLSNQPLGSVMLRQAPFAAVMLLVGYLALLRGDRGRASGPGLGTPPPGLGASQPASDPGTVDPAAPVAAPVDPAILSPRAALWPFLRSASPILVAVGLSVGVGPRGLPLYAAVGLGLALALLLSRGLGGFGWGGLPAAWTSVRWPLAATMASVMLFGRVMEDSGAIDALVTWLVEVGLSPAVLMIILPSAIAYATGVSEVAIGISFPALLPLAPAGHTAGVAAALFGVAFLAYFISPLHLCQVLSSQFFGTSIPRLYREYWPVIAALGALTAVYLWLAFV